MVYFQKVKLPKNLLKTSTRAFWSFYLWVGFLAIKLFRGWPFLLASFYNAAQDGQGREID